MNFLILLVFRIYFSFLGLLAPRVAGRQAFRLFCTPRFRRPMPPSAAEILARAENLSVEVDGHCVAAFRWRPEGAGNAPIALLVHGWESRAARLAPWVASLLDRGFQVVAFDAPAHGASTGRQSNPLLFARTMRRLVDQVGPVNAVVGHSLGGYATMLAAAAGQWLEQDDLEVQRVVVVAGAESGVEAMDAFRRTLGLGRDFLSLILESAAEEAGGKPMAEFDAHRLWVHRPVPTLWLHDPADPEVPLRGAEAVAAACPHVTLERVTDLGHHRIIRDPAVIRRGVEFLSGAEAQHSPLQLARGGRFPLGAGDLRQPHLAGLQIGQVP